MNEEFPSPFSELTPRRAPAALRARVLNAVRQELAQPGELQTGHQSTELAKGLPWGRVVEIAVAASFVLGIGLNVWQQRAENAWQLRVFGPAPVSQDISSLAEAVASVTDAESGRWMQQALSAAQPRRPVADPGQQKRYEQLLRELTDSEAGDKL
jgi:hypothetical protein